MDLAALRDHAAEMLHSFAADLRTPQTATEQSEKSKGHSDSKEAEPDTAAEVHGAGRAESGFTIAEMVSEYRALRASVIRLWTRANGTLSGGDLEDLMRFNEAIDQALAESISRYAGDIDRSKEMFMAILGHDLRTPIGAVIMASQFMLDTDGLEATNRTLTSRIVTSARRMNRMVDDLLDFTRSQLGTGVAIIRAEMDLGVEAANAVEETKAAHPQSTVKLNTSGNLRGNWDAGRIGQLLSNMLGNAVQHGKDRSEISVTARGESKDVVLQVHNRGPAIPSADLPGLFSPFKRLARGAPAGAATSSLGLGLYIVERIVTAHGGTIEVKSTDDGGTFFTVRLPR
jgi:signal transduction histidine kinase